MLKKISHFTLFLFTLPYSLICWLVFFLLHAIGLANFKKIKVIGTFVFVSEWNPWFAEKYYPFSVTLGRAIIFYPGNINYPFVVQHEGVHLAQIEDLMLLSLILGIIFGLSTQTFLVFLAVWTSGGIWQIPNFLTSILRNLYKVEKINLKTIFLDVAYRGSEHEQSAYARTDIDPNSESYLEGKNWQNSKNFDSLKNE